MIRHPSHLLRSVARLILAALLFAPLALQTRAQNLPNLTPLNVNLSAYSARPGDLISVSFTMANTGTANCPASFTRFYLNQFPSTIPSGDPLFEYGTPGIAAGASVRQTNQITIPSNLTVGTYYVWVVADPTPSGVNQTPRTDDATRSSALAVVTVTRQPNLIPQNVILNTSQALRADQIAIMWTLTNAANVTCPASLTGFHVGTSATAPPPPINDLLNLRFETPEIPAFSAIRFTNIVTIPTNTTLGTYYVWVVADDVANSTLNQSSRADDIARSPALSVVSVITRPNLSPFDVTLNKDQVRPNDPIIVTWSITNSGNANCPASTTGFHLGASATIAPTNAAFSLIPTPAINTNSFLRRTNTVTIPANTPLGNYYLWVVADDTNNSALDQSSRSDDAARSSLLAVVSVIRQPNLVVTNVTLNTQIALRGDQVTAVWTIRNTGNTNCPPSLTGLRLGTNATVRPTNSILNISIATPEIRTNAPLRMTNVFTIPTNAPLGTNYLWVIADDVTNSTLNQVSRADDAAVSGPFAIVTVLPQPNLVPLNVTLSSYSTRPGGQLSVVWTMTNSGSAACPPSLTGLYLGSSSSTRPTDSRLSSIQTPAINAHISLRQTNLVTVPTNTATGTYYLWVVVDDVTNSTLNQSSRADDATASADLSVATPPTITLISPAFGATVDAPPTFEWTATGTTNAKIYLAAIASPVLGVDKVVFFNNPPGTNTFRPASTNWVVAVTNLGFATNYFWTIGSADAAHRETYAEWRPFKSSSLFISDTAIVTSSGVFQFRIAAPNQRQIIVEASETLTGWTAFVSFLNTAGAVNVTDPSAGTRPKRFFRIKP